MEELILGDDLAAALEARATVVGMFRLHGAMLPADPALLAALASMPGLGAAEMAAAMTGLIQDGACRVVIIGNEPHLVALPRNETPDGRRSAVGHLAAQLGTIAAPATAPVAPPTVPSGITAGATPPTAPPVAAPEAPPDPAAERNALEVALDVEHERLVLYRVALILELIAALLFVRSFL